MAVSVSQSLCMSLCEAYYANTVNGGYRSSCTDDKIRGIILNRGPSSADCIIVQIGVGREGKGSRYSTGISRTPETKCRCACFLKRPTKSLTPLIPRWIFIGWDPSPPDPIEWTSRHLGTQLADRVNPRFGYATTSRRTGNHTHWGAWDDALPMQR